MKNGMITAAAITGRSNRSALILRAGSVTGGLAAAAWGYSVALAIGASAVAVGLVIVVATPLRRGHGGASTPHSAAA